MDELKENIDRQIESNKGKNLFAADPDNSLRFLQKTVIAIERTVDPRLLKKTKQKHHETRLEKE